MRTIQILFSIGILHTLYDTRLDDNIFLIVNNSIKLLCWHTEKVTNLVRKTTEIPDMSNRDNQFNMSGTLTTYLLLSYLNTTTIADNTLITDTLVLTAGTLVILCWTEDTLAEQTITFWFIGTIVDSLWLGYLTKRVLKNLLR